MVLRVIARVECSRMKPIIPALALALAIVLSGQLVLSQQKTNSPLLDAAETHYYIGGQDEYLYLRVYPDGTAEAQLLKRAPMFGQAHIETRRSVLNKKDFSELEALISSGRTENLQSRYPQRIGDLLDDFTAWNIRLKATAGKQQLEVVAFAPDMAKQNNKPYPPTLLTLGCLMQKLRAQTVGESIHLDRECQSVQVSD